MYQYITCEKKLNFLGKTIIKKQKKCSEGVTTCHVFIQQKCYTVFSVYRVLVACTWDVFIEAVLFVAYVRFFVCFLH